jgi:hypothetical protein
VQPFVAGATKGCTLFCLWFFRSVVLSSHRRSDDWRERINPRTLECGYAVLLRASPKTLTGTLNGTRSRAKRGWRLQNHVLLGY